MDVTIDALVAFVARAQLSPRTEAAGVDLERWRGAQLELALLKELHRAVVGDQQSVRRILADGSSILAPAQPGQLRTKPQGFRAGDHVEVAWEQGRLKAGLVELCRETAPLLARAPVSAAARLVWALSRAQPFTGLNERVALVLAGWVLRGLGLPAPNVERIERAPGFESALVAASADERSALERVLADAIWDEVLALVEAVAPVPPADAQRWTLADEHAAASAARARATKVSADELAGFVDDVAGWIEREVPIRSGVTLSARQRDALETLPVRRTCAWEAAIRGRHICPHEPITVVRWALTDRHGLQMKLVLGAAGRGLTGAASAHISLELFDQPMAATSLAMLLVPDENRDARHARTVGWLERAWPRAVEQCPLRS